MVRRLPVVIGLLLLVVGIDCYACTRRSRTFEQIFPATINHDCAPWDGPAFTVSIPTKDANISISVYQAPDSRLPTTFLFPDNTMSVGSAIFVLPIGPPEHLKGKVSFQGIKQGNPVEGVFDFTTEAGKTLRGKFTAEWVDDVVSCG